MPSHNNNQFFHSNSISTFKTFTSNFYQPQKPSSNISNTHHPKTTPRQKRITSLSSTCKLNPQNFLNRQVFRNKLYSQKPFNIAIQFRQQTKEQQNELFQFNRINDKFNQKINKIIGMTSQEGFKNVMKNLKHLFKTIHQNVNQENGQKDKLIKLQLIRLKQTVQRMINMLMKEMQIKQTKCLQLITAQKATSNNHYNTLISKKSLLLPKNAQFQPTIHNKLPTQSAISSKLYSLQQKLLKSQQKVNTLQFQNNQKLLLIQKIQQHLKQKDIKIQQLSQKINKMENKINKIDQNEDYLNYKIKKLKEELEIAHIVKDQNIQDKLKYIMEL